MPEALSLPRRLVGIGHSHLVALIEADAARLAQPGAPPSHTTFIQLLAPENQPTLLPDGTLNPDLKAKVLDACGPDEDPPGLFGCVSGNEYHYIGLVDHPRPFDFVLPPQPDLPLRPNAEIIPSQLMRQALGSQMLGGLEVLRALRIAFGPSLLIVQSPPPVPHDDYIREHPIQFAEQVTRHGVAPAALRMKLWLLQSDIYRAACEEEGLDFLPVPPAACDPAGFLRQPGWRGDPVHANEWYGRHVLDQIEAFVPPVPRTHAA